MRRVVLPGAFLVLLAAPALAQQPRASGSRPGGDSVVIRVAIVLAPGDPVNASYEYWIGRRPPERSATGATGTLRAQALVDTRAAPTGRGRAGIRGGVVYAPGLTPEEARAAGSAVQHDAEVRFAVTSRTVLGALPDDSTQDVLNPPATSASPLSARAMAWDPPGRRIPAVRLALQAPAISRSARVDTVTIRYRASGSLADGDTVWVVVGDGGSRRWSAAAVLSRGGAASLAAQPADSGAPSRAGAAEEDIVFAVGQRPGDPRALAPGFAIARELVSTRVQAAQGARSAAQGSEAALVAEVRQFGVMALDVAMPRSGEVSVRIVDLRGREVARIGPQLLDRGYWTVRWDGRRADGSVAPPGVYLAITQALGAAVVTRLIVTTVQ